MSFEGPAWIVAATVAGVLLLWCKEGQGKLRVYTLSSIVDRLPLSENVRYVIQLIVFITLGTFVSLIFTSPTNPRQAFAAGLGWTASLTTRKR